MTIRSKFLFVIALAFLLPSVGLFVLLTMRPIQGISSTKDNELKMSAMLAGQIYKNQESLVLQAALDAAEQISANAYIEQLSIMQPIPGASSRPGAASLNPPREKPLANLGDMLIALNKKYNININFLVLTNPDGTVISTLNPAPALDDVIKNKNGQLNKDPKNARVISFEAQRQTIQLLMPATANHAAAKPETVLVIEAVAPVLRLNNDILGMVFAGYIVNDTPGIVSAAKTEISRARSFDADVSIISPSQTVAMTTLGGNVQGQRPPVDPGVIKSVDPSIHTFDLAGHRVVGGFYPIRSGNTVVGQIMVTQPKDILTDLITTAGRPAIVALGGTFIFTMLAVLILAGRLARALRRVNTDIIRIGLGDFDDPIDPPARRDEAGDLVESLERLRVTVKQAIERLQRRNKS